MASKKKEDRIKSAQSMSPYGRKSKEATTGGISNDGKQLKMIIWPEWSDADVNNEKWEIAVKSKEKEKTKSPQTVQNLFEDPDGRLRLPPSLKVVKWKRSNEYFNKTPVVVDSEVGIHKFDIFSTNEHLFVSETMRWIICQINILWSTSEKKISKENESLIPDPSFVGPNGTFHSWRFWDHIYSMNKVGKGLPQYNPSGKYIVKLFWMGEWRKISVDDSLPFDEQDRLLLPITSLEHEMWPIILTKALLKIAYLSYSGIQADTEFGDFSIIHALTGWIPQKKTVLAEHQEAVWNNLTELLPQWKYPNDKVPNKDENVAPENTVTEVQPEKQDTKEGAKDKNKKESKDNKPKEKKEKERGKSGASPETLTYEKPEVLLVASYKSNYDKLNFLLASKMADHSEALRKIGIVQTYSHPVLLNFYRDCPLERPKTPEPVPAWKLIRPIVKQEVPFAKDCTKHGINARCESVNLPIRSLEIQTPFLNYQITNHNLITSLSSISKSPVAEIQEDINETKRSLVDDTAVVTDDISMETEMTKKGAVSNKKEGNQSNFKQTEFDDNMVEMEVTNKVESPTKESITNWIDLNSFCDCFQTIYIYHKVETYPHADGLSDMKPVNIDQKEPLYIFSDNTEKTEIVFSLSVFCRWFPNTDSVATIEMTPSIASPALIKKDSTINDLFENEPELLHPSNTGLFIAEHHSWKHFKVGQCFKRMRTNGTKAISLEFPPGRHCIRLFIQAPNGYNCKLISKLPFRIGNEETIMTLCTEEPKRIKEFGTDILNCFKCVIENFSDLEKRKLAEENLFNLLLGRKSILPTVSVPTLSNIFHSAVLKTISKINNDIVTKDLIFALRSVNMVFDFSETAQSNVLNKQNTNSSRNSAKAPPTTTTKPDNRKPSSVKQPASGDTKEEKKSEETQREYNQSEIERIKMLQKIARGHYVRRVNESRNPESKYHGHVTIELQKLLNHIKQNESQFVKCIISSILEVHSEIFRYCGFDNDRQNHVCVDEYSGKATIQGSNNFCILFRDIFTVLNPCKSKYGVTIKLNCNASKCTLMLINNDTGDTVTDSVLKRIYLTELKPLTNGYTIMAYVKETEAIINWKLKLICDAHDNLPKLSKGEICSDFSIWRIKDYFIPDENGTLFLQNVKVKTDLQITFLLKLSNSAVPLTLSIINNDEEVYSVDGNGSVLIPSFVFSKNAGEEIQEGSGRSPSRTSNKSKRNKEKPSDKTSRTNSSSSNEEYRVNKYSLQAFVDNTFWSISAQDAEFLETIRTQRKTDTGENKSWNETTTKPSQGSDGSKKDGSQKPQAKAKGKEKPLEATKGSKSSDKVGTKGAANEPSSSRPNSSIFDEEKPNWKLYVFTDSLSDENIQIYRNNEKFEELVHMKKVWKELDPNRFEKGKQYQLKFLEEHQSINTEAKVEKPEEIPKAILLPFDLSIFYRMDEEMISPTARYNVIDGFRKKQREWDMFCTNEKVDRKKKITDSMMTYYELQKITDAHRLKYFKSREAIRRK